MYAFRTSLGPVELAFTDRHGGVSAAPYDSLNLAVAGDEPEHLAENHRRLLADFAPADDLVTLSQVHGADVTVVGPQGPRPEPAPSGSVATLPRAHAVADAAVTARPGTTLMIRVADCVPVLFADAARGVLGAAHCGRAGLVAGVLAQTVSSLRELGAHDLTAWIGPHVCAGCYEVPPELQDQVASLEPATRASTTWGTASLDLGAGVRAQLGALGVSVDEQAVRCTRESPDLYSYRRDGADSGRNVAVIRLAPVAARATGGVS